MARRTKEDAQRTREQLIDAAEMVFHRKGVAQTSLNDIAQEAQLTRGAFYWHFKNKQDIFKAMLDRQTLSFKQTIQEMDRTTGADQQDPLARLRESILFVINEIECNPNRRRVYEIIFQKCEITAQSEPIGTLLKENALIGSARMRKTFGTAMQEKILPENLDIESAIVHLQAQVTGALYLWLLMPESFELKRQTAHLIDLFFAQLPDHFLLR
ncbi:TetR family transcriptional regulator [uncultured Marinobacter sp.]|uniref:TetR family transcriptional regulator n=1 Tax=uncultured Marinobacter sp. TaxID=187379 RepID=UPI00261F9A51|nr:TetR family transcriptional regulator [uncultured Marinobacter sp.]